jgi:NAD(P)-dependent dehydrogenase (short-subunit alcohol dehydrogenase family)
MNKGHKMKKILLTGATDGIGLETAKLLAAQGHCLLLHGRSDNKLAAAVQTLKAMAPQADIQTYCADLSSFSQIYTMVQEILAEHTCLDVIINNAGILKTDNSITADGLDIRFMVNTFAPYIIASQLLPILASDGRIVNLSSAAQAPVDIEAMAGNTSISDAIQAYAQSKLALTIWSQQLAATLPSSQVVVAVNPGSLLASKMVQQGFGVAGKDLGIGANILLKAALAPEFANASGKYFDNDAGHFALAHAEAQQTQKCEQIMTAITAIVDANKR